MVAARRVPSWQHGAPHSGEHVCRVDVKRSLCVNRQPLENCNLRSCGQEHDSTGPSLGSGGASLTGAAGPGGRPVRVPQVCVRFE